MTLKIKTKTIGSGDIVGNMFSVTIGELEKVGAAQTQVVHQSGEIIEVYDQVISGNIVEAYVLRKTESIDISGHTYWAYTATSGNQISGAVATVIVDGY